VKIILAVAVLFLAAPVTSGQQQKSAKRAYDGFAVAFPCAVQKDSKYPSYSCDSGKWARFKSPRLVLGTSVSQIYQEADPPNSVRMSTEMQHYATAVGINSPR
jgi:hypothetical protein